MKLIPMPRLLRKTQEEIINKTIAFENQDLDPRLVRAIQKLPLDRTGLPLTVHAGNADEESYTLDLTNSGIIITAPSDVGAFCGIQTLRQIMENETVYACHIEDRPEFGFRGFYHDVTRGRVPTLETLKELVDYLAYMKQNSLQLYVEHSFAFREYADTIGRTGCLTAEEIRELDDYCYDNFIELIPSVSCFGHLYVLLEQPQYKHLQEAENFRQTHIYWYERMAHHTIDPTNPESFCLIKSLIDQFMPLFRSNKFNICCDETFDLKNGKHKDMDTGELYISFVEKLIQYVKSCGKEVMMWGDILLQHPQRVGDVPNDVVLLNWYYDADLDKTENQVKVIAEKNRTQIVCPATWAWNHFSESLCDSVPNITNVTQVAKQYAAKGILNTNWGDYGDPCSFDLSLFGIAYGAARSWNIDSLVENVACAVDSLIYANAGTFDVLYRLSEIERVVHYGDLSWMYNNLYYPDKLAFQKRTEDQLKNAREQALELYEKLTHQVWKKDCFRKEILLAIQGAIMMSEQMLLLQGYTVARFVDTEKWLGQYRTAWLSKNRESELAEIENMFRGLEKAIAEGRTV